MATRTIGKASWGGSTRTTLRPTLVGGIHTTHTQAYIKFYSTYIHATVDPIRNLDFNDTNVGIPTFTNTTPLGAQVDKKLMPNFALRSAIERWCKARQGKGPVDGDIRV